MRIPEPHELYDAYSDQQEKLLEQLPICEYCGHHIQDDYLWDINETLYHEECAEALFRKTVDDYE